MNDTGNREGAINKDNEEDTIDTWERESRTNIGSRNQFGK